MFSLHRLGAAIARHAAGLVLARYHGISSYWLSLVQRLVAECGHKLILES
jgi:hypothetical protein